VGTTGYLVPRGGKTWQRRIELPDFIETFLRKLGSVGETSIERVGDATRKKVDNGGRAIREFRSIKSLATVLLVTIISIVKPKKGLGQRTGGAALPGAAAAGAGAAAAGAATAAVGRPGNAG